MLYIIIIEIDKKIERKIMRMKGRKSEKKKNHANRERERERDRERERERQRETEREITYQICLSSLRQQNRITKLGKVTMSAARRISKRHKLFSCIYNIYLYNIHIYIQAG